MHANWKVLLAVAAGALIGATGIQFALAAAKPPANLIVEYEITDPAVFRAFVQSSNAPEPLRDTSTKWRSYMVEGVAK